jgi:exodeoxyribonuclease VII large subunit
MMRYATVTEVVRRIKDDLQKDYRLQSVAMEGNIINLKRASNGHYYMNIHDDKASLHSILFASRVGRSMDGVREGDHVVVIGSIQVYEKTGSVSLIIERLFSYGVGTLQAEYERLKRDLEQAGYFSQAHKKSMPRFPWMVGVLTSRTGAVLHDICKIAAERNPYIQIRLFPVPVQGAGADVKIAAVLAKAGANPDLDVLILARGGGSMEDLWCFNSAAVVKAIYDAAVPVITAIGHETDTTLADFVADMRAATPTHAAELAFPAYDEIAMDLAGLEELAFQSCQRRLERCGNDLANVKASLQPHRYDLFLQMKRQGTAHLLQEAQHRLNARCASEENRLLRLVAALRAGNPGELVRKGYGQLEQDGHIVSDIRDISLETPLWIQLVDGAIRTDVKEVTIYDKRK